MSVSQGLASRRFGPTTHLVISVAGHDGILPNLIPLYSFCLVFFFSPVFFPLGYYFSYICKTHMVAEPDIKPHVFPKFLIHISMTINFSPRLLYLYKATNGN